MKDKLLALNLQFFNDGEGEGDEGFDFDSFDEEFESDYQEEETNEDEANAEGEETAEGEGEGESDEADSDEDEGEGEGEERDLEDEGVHSDDEHKRNEAFRQLREQAEEGEKYKAFVKQVADANGMTEDQVLQRFEEQRLQQEAQQQGTSPEMLKRVRELEQENTQAKEQARNERLNAQAENLMNKYDLSEQEVQDFAREAVQKGVDLYNTDMETVYKGMNHEKIVQKEVEKARQQELANKKQRQQNSAEAHDGESTNDDSHLDEISDIVKRETANW